MKKGKAKQLTAKQERFCREYLKDLNATQAAIRAGYRSDNADVVGPRLVGKSWIASRIQKLGEARTERLEIKADDILRELWNIATSDIGDAYDETGQLKPIHEIPKAFRRTISGLEVTERIEGEERAVFTRKIKNYDKNKALELLGKNLKLFSDRVEHSIDSKLEDLIAGSMPGGGPGPGPDPAAGAPDAGKENEESE